MTKDKSSKFTVITNKELETATNTNNAVRNQDYHTNPLLEKLIKFKFEQKHERFTVEDLLKW